MSTRTEIVEKKCGHCRGRGVIIKRYVIAKCRICEKEFVKKRKNTFWCSDRCQSTEHARRYRARKKALEAEV